MMSDIVLRHIEYKDLETLRQWRNSPNISKYMFSISHITKEDQLKWFQDINSKTDSHYWVVETDNTPMGFASLIPFQHANDSYEFGLYIGNQTFMGGGMDRKFCSIS